VGDKDGTDLDEGSLVLGVSVDLYIHNNVDFNTCVTVPQGKDRTKPLQQDLTSIANSKRRSSVGC
jgi:hypothetical protein